MKQKSLSVNFIYQISYQLLQILLPLITAPYVSRVLGPENMGTYSYVFSVGGYFVLFGALGIGNYGNRLVAQSRDDPALLNRNFTGLLCNHLLTSLAVVAVYLIYCMFCPREQLVYMLIVGIQVLAAVINTNWLYFGLEEHRLIALRNSAVKILSAICVFAFVKTRDDLWVYVLITALSTLVGDLYCLVNLNKFVKLVKVTWADIASHFKPNLVLFVPALAVSLYTVLSKVMLGAMAGMEQSGYYDGASRIFGIASGVITAFGVVLLPRMSNLVANNDTKTVNKYIDLSVKYIMCISVAITFGLMAISDTLIPLYYGNEFAESSTLLEWIMISTLFLSLANIIRTQYLIPNAWDKTYIVAVITGAAVNILVNCLLIPPMGAKGAVIGTVCAEASVCVVQVFAVRKQLPVGRYLRRIALFIGMGAVMYFGVKCVQNAVGHSLVSLLMQMLAGVLIYCALTVVYLVATRDELFKSILQKTFKRRK